MKILSGQYKGRNFYMPAGIRPTQNVLRKAVFDLIGHDLQGLKMLELFAGSGAIGLEALSLGVDSVTFVESSLKAVETIEENIRILGVDPGQPGQRPWSVLQQDAFAAIKSLAVRGLQYDVIFADPPFGRGLAKKTLKTLSAYDILHPNCLILIQYSERESLPNVLERFSFIKERRYGNSFLKIYQATHSETSS